MSDIRNDAFSAYTSANMKPRNITSDMWEPITTSGNYTAYTPPKRESTEKTQSAPDRRQTKTEHKTSARGAEERSAPAKKKVQPESAPAGKKKAKKKPSEKFNRPISSGRPEPSEKKASSNRSSAKKKNNKKSAKSDVRIAYKQRDKTNKAFLKLIKSGKSVDEARIIITKRKLIKRKLSTFCSVLLLFLFAVVFIVSYTYCEGAEISDIIIDGDEVYTNEEILTAASLGEGMNMLTIREKTVNDKVTTALPFISVVSVKYELPDTLKLSIISTSERLIIKNGSGYICIDKTGKVVSEKKKKLSKGQYLVTGLAEQEYTLGEIFEPSEENKEKYDLACEVAFAADTNAILNTGTINVTDKKDITLTYKSRLRIYLGSGDKLQSKLQTAERVMIENKAQNKTGYINAKYDIAEYFMQGSMEA